MQTIAAIRGRAVLGALLGAALVLATVAPALPQEPVAAIRLVVTHLDGIVGAGSAAATADARLRVAVDNVGELAIGDLRVVVEVHARATSRGLLRAALDRDIHGGGAVLVTDELVRGGADLPPGDIAGVSFSLAGPAAGWIGGSGVHPIAISLVRGTQVLDRVVTAVVHLDNAPAARLDTLVAVPIDDRPWRVLADQFPPDVDGAIRPGGRLDRLLLALERVPEAPIALAPSAHLLEDLLDRADGFVQLDGAENPRLLPESPAATLANGMLQRIRNAATGRPVAPIAMPYADVDMGLLASAPGVVADLASEAAASAGDRIEDLLGRQPDAGVLLMTDGFGNDALSLLPTPTVVVSWDAVVGPDLSLDANLASPVRRATAGSGRRVTLLVADPYVERLLDRPDAGAGPVVVSQRVIAETAMVHFQAPGLQERPFVVLLPRDADLPADSATRLLAGLASAPWMQLTEPDAVRNGADVDPVQLRDVVGPPGLPDDLRESLEDAFELVDGLSRTLVRDEANVVDPRVLSDDLARASSVWLREDVAARRRGVAAVRTAAEAALGTIEVANTAGITLTAEEGTIPITLRRPDGAPLDVRVLVDASGRLGWPAGAESDPIRLVPGAPQTVSFATIARTRGTFPLVVTVTDPSGTRVLHEATISVRSTAISRPAVILLGGLVLLLVVFGVVRRGPREARLQVVQDLPRRADADKH